MINQLINLRFLSVPQTACCAARGYCQQRPHKYPSAPHRRGPSRPHPEVCSHQGLVPPVLLAAQGAWRAPQHRQRPRMRTLLASSPAKLDGRASLPCHGVCGQKDAPRQGLGWPQQVPGFLLCKWSGQPVAPGNNASFCLFLEGTQEKRAAKNGWTFCGRLLVTFPVRFCSSEGCR